MSTTSVVQFKISVLNGRMQDMKDFNIQHETACWQLEEMKELCNDEGPLAVTHFCMMIFH